MENDTTKEIGWNGHLADQLDWHWQHLLRPKLDGLRDLYRAKGAGNDGL